MIRFCRGLVVTGVAFSGLEGGVGPFCHLVGAQAAKVGPIAVPGKFLDVHQIRKICCLVKNTGNVRT